MGITRSSVSRLRAGSAVAAAAVLVLTAAAGASAFAAPSGPSGPAAPAAPADGPAEGPAAGRSSAASAYGPARVPLGISRLAQGPGHDIAITIDDGPDPRWTPQVLEVLRENHVKATFCMIGTRAQQYPALVRSVAAEGHRLCDHSVDHDVTMDHKPVAYQRQQILDGKSMIEQAAPGVAVSYYRAPGGAFTPDSRAIAAASGMRPLGWSVDPKDWSRPGLASIVATVEGNLPAQPTVLFHDGGGDRSETVAALKEYLPWLTARGYAFTFPKLTTP
ncbi:polysaccharide deacetylase family protein [Streptomyces sp. AP-93]|uniref:polysaccharide deacetylase family protein n=1 Tax=Streptomyces sp. AP-93 TaxID=2929048 RepID=UPI001FAF7897|nr:polysaccharide deacetylase family protein [Streptomyces sp. AP-93]MCJ0869703.1 polysaccharide deacetylase family protein [Streptomyces sp. AP-93]